MNNNNILKKLSIANSLRHFEIKEVFKLGSFSFSSSQIKSFMAGSQNKNYEKLSHEHLEGFLNGLIIYSRGSIDEPDALPRLIESFIIGLIEAEKTEVIEEIRCLIKDTSDHSNEASNAST
ncbi:MAG: DUF1456 family protein [Mariprofundaceae bacterium]|nr:DUF1456 family protein [Mariprofundaceae bacterium]